MKITSFEEFKELSLRGTFVPVVKEIVADLLTPVSAFLKIAEHADYAFLLESVEGGEHVGRYSFLGKDPFLILTSKNGKSVLERGGTTTESERPFVDTLRTLMADYRSPFVQGLPRFTGGAVGYFGYGASTWFEPVLGDLGKSDDGADQAGFMLFDTVLAFDHVQHRILIIANARITADDDLESLYQFACAKIQFLERELDQPLSTHTEAARQGSVELRSSYTKERLRGARQDGEGIHRRGRYLPGGAVAAVRSQARRGSLHGVPRAAARESVTATCISSGWPACRSSARRRRCWCESKARASRRTRLRARAGAAGAKKKICGSAKS